MDGELRYLAAGNELGRYEIRRLLGRGGMGCVYEAVHRDLKKRVAIKTLLPALAEQPTPASGSCARARPRRASAIRTWSTSPTWAPRAGHLPGDGVPRGRGPGAPARAPGLLSPAEAADIMLPVAAAIATAHEQGVIHRDLKPENIFLARSAYGAVHPKVLDFGISKVLGDRGRARSPAPRRRSARCTTCRPSSCAPRARPTRAATSTRWARSSTSASPASARSRRRASTCCSRRSPRAVRAPVDAAPRPAGAHGGDRLRAMSLDPPARFESVKQLGAALLEFGGETTRIMWAPFFGAAPVECRRARSPDRRTRR